MPLGRHWEGPGRVAPSVLGPDEALASGLLFKSWGPPGGTLPGSRSTCGPSRGWFVAREGGSADTSCQAGGQGASSRSPFPADGRAQGSLGRKEQGEGPSGPGLTLSPQLLPHVQAHGQMKPDSGDLSPLPTAPCRPPPQDTVGGEAGGSGERICRARHRPADSPACRPPTRYLPVRCAARPAHGAHGQELREASRAPSPRCGWERGKKGDR